MEPATTECNSCGALTLPQHEKRCNLCCCSPSWLTGRCGCCADSWAAPGLEIKAIAAYKGPGLPDDEEERMRTVCCAVQDDQDDPVLSSICKLVCSLLRVPTAGSPPQLPSLQQDRNGCAW